MTTPRFGRDHDDEVKGPSADHLAVAPAPHARPGPVDRPVMRQRWERLTFLHWAFEPAIVQRRLPEGLTVDTHDGAAWVALVPFRMEDIAPPRGPVVPYLGSFNETNVRTYVRGPDGRPGVWFDSLDIDRALPVAVARAGYGLPYMWADMNLRAEGDLITYTARRRRPHRRAASSRVTVRIGDPIAPGDLTPLEVFLTARWRLFAAPKGRLVVAEVGHPPWPLHRAETLEIDDDLVAAAGYPHPSAAPHTLYSPGVPVVAGRPGRL